MLSLRRRIPAITLPRDDTRGPRGSFPTPAWHGLFRADVRAGLRDRHRDATPPLEVLAKAAAKPLVCGQAHLICGLDERLDEPSPLLLGDGEVRVVAEQRAVASQLAGVGVGPAEDLAQPRSEMFDMPGSPLRAEHLGQNGVGEAATVLGIRQPL